MNTCQAVADAVGNTRSAGHHYRVLQSATGRVGRWHGNGSGEVVSALVCLAVRRRESPGGGIQTLRLHR